MVTPLVFVVNSMKIKNVFCCVQLLRSFGSGLPFF
jgi:hypothetical protein